MLIIPKWLKMDGMCPLNTNKKPWSLDNMEMSLFGAGCLPIGRNRHSTIKANWKHAGSSQSAVTREYIPIEYMEQNVVTLHYGDIAIGVERPLAAESVILPERPSKTC